jgi:acetyl-CoA carboxylase biotin carboxyl carrier protein
MSLTHDDMAALAAAFAASGLGELHLAGPGTDVHLKRPASDRAAAAISAQRAGAVLAPCVGVFMSSHPSRTEPLVLPGSGVRAGQVVALLRIGLLLRQVVAAGDGVLGAPLVPEGTIVGYGTRLFAFHPDSLENQP